MADPKVVSTGEMVRDVETIANDGTVTKHDKDDFKNEFTIPLVVREYDNTIFAGMRMQWGTIDDVDGRGPLEICTGAGLGSSFATVGFDGKNYVISATQLVEAFLKEVLDK